ncbi:uncharacterized protein LOC128222271 [Mya arenaria]|uniref:uncharacterized protein LOC128222271 n=1 Tax=Mya arenaria TaxID=6604 RepID=UPI0022E54742|nr:uncharacterized protein LOC128222271 [Mya arenaria]
MICLREFDLPTMVLTEEEQLMFRDENVYPHATVLINNTNRKEEEIEAHKKENIKILETIRDQKEDLLRARENETKLKETIEELGKECTELSHFSGKRAISLRTLWQ